MNGILAPTTALLTLAAAVSLAAAAALALFRAPGGVGGTVRAILAAAAAAFCIPIAFAAFSSLRVFYWLGAAVAIGAVIGWLMRGRVRAPAFRVPEPRRIALPSGRLVALILVGLTFVFGATILLETPANQDIAWLVYVSERVLDGARLYRDIYEVNPPLVLWIMTGAVAVGRAIGASPFTVYDVFVLALAAGSLAVSAWLLGRLRSPVAARWIVVALAFLFVPLPGHNFGQREHLLVLLFTPYVLLAAARIAEKPVPWWAAAGIALGGAVGLALKPYFLVGWVAVEGYVALVGGPRAVLRRLEPWIVAVAGVAYLLAVTSYVPAYWSFIGWARTLYAFYYPSPLRLILTHVFVPVLLAAVLLAFMVRGDGALRDPRRLLAVVAAGFFVSILWQGKGWDYHWYPVVACALLSLALTALDAFRGLRAGWLAVTALALTVTASAAARSLDPARRASFASYPYALPQLLSAVRQLGDGGPVLVVSASLEPSFPLVNYAGVRWASRFNCLWFAPAFYRAPGATHASSGLPSDTVQLAVLRRYGEDFVREKPRLVIVDTPPLTREMVGFDVLRMLSRDPGFAAAWREYGAIGSIGPFRIFRRSGS